MSLQMIELEEVQMIDASDEALEAALSVDVDAMTFTMDRSC